MLVYLHRTLMLLQLLEYKKEGQKLMKKEERNQDGMISLLLEQNQLPCLLQFMMKL